jgi:4-oxalocrotonate tautomerase
MPLIHVSMARGRTEEQKRALLAAVTRAAQESIDAPLASIRVWITEFEGTDFMSAGEILADRRSAEEQP